MRLTYYSEELRVWVNCLREGWYQMAS